MKGYGVRPRTVSVYAAVFLVLAFSVASELGIALAAPKTAAQPGITISPYLQQLNVPKNQDSVTYPVTITDHYAVPVAVHISTTDFTALGLRGNIGFYAPDQDQNNPYSLRAYVSFPFLNTVILPNQSQTVPVSVSNISSMPPGGHFGAIMFGIQNATPVSGNNVTLNQQSASLLFVSTDGVGTKGISVSTPIVGSFYAALPSDVNAVFSNSGNTQETPIGMAYILNSHNQVMAQGQINPNSSLILPHSKRLLDVYLDQTVTHVLPGRYHFKLNYQYVGEATMQTYTQSFTYIGTLYIITAGGLIIIGGYAVKYRRELWSKRAWLTLLKYRNIKLAWRRYRRKRKGIKEILVSFDDDTTYKIR